MKQQTTRLFAAVATAWAVGGGGGTRAAGPEAKRNANVEFHVLGTIRGLATYPIGGVTQMGADTSTPWNVSVRLAPPKGESECGGSQVSVGFVAPDFVGPAAPLLVWGVKATIGRARTDEIEVEYDWERRLRSDRGREPTRGHDKIVVAEGSRVLLDIVSPLPDDPASACYHNLALELVASLAEDPALVDRRIAYDLWLTSEDGGKRVTRRLSLIGKQGEKVGFDYGALRSRIDGLSEAESKFLETLVNGHIRGRIQSDGTLEIALNAEREARGGDHGWATAAHGDKLVRTAAGETVRLELPPPPLPDPVHISNAAAVERAMAGHQVSLVLTATPMD